MQNLKEKFNDAKLDVVIADTPFIVRDARIFQLNIEENKKGEYFKIYTGEKDNMVLVMDIDKKKRQVLLRVKEPRRRFVEKVRDFKDGIVEEREIERFTSPFVRTYLMGMDERHLFISEIPHSGPVNRVQDAHEALKPQAVKNRNTQKIKRQGEWFFIPINKKEREEIEELLKNMYCIEERVPIQRTRGNPHIARYKLTHYVKGKIKHAQHATVDLRGWHRYVKNTESTEQPVVKSKKVLNIRRFTWID